MRVTELLHTLSNMVVQRTLHVYFVTFRPPTDGVSPLSHSRIAVIEHMQSALPGEYEAPLELVHQAHALDDYTNAYEQHWRTLHADAVQSQHDRHMRALHHNQADPVKLRAWCERRVKRNENTGEINCVEVLSRNEHTKERVIRQDPAADKGGARRRYVLERHPRRQLTEQQPVEAATEK
jgi:hypothetical protein